MPVRLGRWGGGGRGRGRRRWTRGSWGGSVEGEGGVGGKEDIYLHCALSKILLPLCGMYLVTHGIL